MSVRVMSRVWESSSAQGGSLLVLLAIADYADDNGNAWPSLGKLAAKARLSVRQVCTVLDDLEDSGELKRQRSRGGRNQRSRYVVTVSENCEVITEKKQQRKNNSVICDMETVKSTSHAINHHRTTNTDDGPDHLPDPVKKNRRAAPAVPADLQSIVSRVIARINELARTAYKPDSRIVVNGLVQRLKFGASEADCIAVIEDRWQRWRADHTMRQHFNPDTLFREDNFEKYKNAVRMGGNIATDRLYGSGGFVG